MELRIYAALSEDINSGWIWLPECIVATRNIVSISSSSSGKKVYCEAIAIGDNFIKRYKNQATCNIDDPDKVIIINEWYRDKLGVTTKETKDFEIKIIDNRLNKAYAEIRAALNHPQTAIKLATILGIVSVMLGLLSLFL